MQLELKVEYADGRTQVVAVKPVTQVAFERHFKRGFAGIGADLHVEHLYWLAWHALRPDAPSDFDVFLSEVAGIEGVDDPDPSQAGPTPAG